MELLEVGVTSKKNVVYSDSLPDGVVYDLYEI